MATGGGGLLAKELDGLELAGESSEGVAAFFQGVADPFAAAIPGKTETGLAEAFAETADGTGLGAAGAAGVFRGGGGGAGAAA